ncbi:hypothetical protein S225a_07080 [Candidatus Brocadiaceae bacterium S225]|nr:hypothetical protein S225a_07080 [Candidatus Brocadiaceae bacterium S225]
MEMESDRREHVFKTVVNLERMHHKNTWDERSEKYGNSGKKHRTIMDEVEQIDKERTARVISKV